MEAAQLKEMRWVGCFLLWWVMGGGTANGSAKERRQQQQPINSSSMKLKRENETNKANLELIEERRQTCFGEVKQSMEFGLWVEWGPKLLRSAVSSSMKSNQLRPLREPGNWWIELEGEVGAQPTINFFYLLFSSPSFFGGLCPPQAAWGSAKGRERNERELVKLNEAERIEEINSLSFGWWLGGLWAGPGPMAPPKEANPKREREDNQK